MRLYFNSIILFFFIFVVPVTDITSSIDIEEVRFLPEVDKTAGIAKKELKVG